MDTHEGNRLLLRPSKIGTLGLLLVCSLFVAIGVWMGSRNELMGWFVASFFGLGIIVAAVQFLPNASYLLLTADGFEIRTLYRTSFRFWNEVEYFSTVTVKHNGMAVKSMVAITFAEHYDKAKMMRGISRAIAGCEGALPDTYGMKAEQLAELLNEWKNRFSEGQ